MKVKEKLLLLTIVLITCVSLFSFSGAPAHAATLHTTSQHPLTATGGGCGWAPGNVARACVNFDSSGNLIFTFIIYSQPSGCTNPVYIWDYFDGNSIGTQRNCTPFRTTDNYGGGYTSPGHQYRACMDMLFINDTQWNICSPIQYT